ncbi:MAG: hypothetical protein ABSB22_04525 [Thermodesulfobacteriota bacterium]
MSRKMKRILMLALIMVLLLSTILTSQSKNIPDGFIGLKWGYSLNKMREEMVLSSVDIDKKNPDKVTAIIDQDRFNPFPDLNITGIALGFYKDKLYSGTIVISKYEDWNFLIKTIKDKYGDPSTEEMKNVYGNSIGIVMTWSFGIGGGVITAGFNQAKEEGYISYYFPPKELRDQLSSQEEKERSKVRDKF